MSFADLGLSSSILKAVSDMGYETPTPIQLQAIPAVLAQRDLLAAAQTGTGKTAGFTLPILHRLSESGNQARGNQVRALVLTPTRELAAQVEESVVNYGKYLPLRSAVVFGGVKINPQMIKLKRGVDILVATPGRLLDLHNQNAVRFDQLEILVLDEADRMLDMGFINDIKKNPSGSAQRTTKPHVFGNLCRGRAHPGEDNREQSGRDRRGADGDHRQIGHPVDHSGR